MSSLDVLLPIEKGDARGAEAMKQLPEGEAGRPFPRTDPGQEVSWHRR